MSTANAPSTLILLPKPKRSYAIPTVVVCVTLFMYYILFMRRQFIRSDQQIPFFWDRQLNKTLKHYVNTLPSRYTVFLTGPYESGKTRTLLELTENLMRKERLVINFDATKFGTTKMFVEHALQAVRKSLISIRPYLSNYKLKEIATATSLRRANLNLYAHQHSLPGLDPSLIGVYNNLARSLNSIILNQLNSTDSSNQQKNLSKKNLLGNEEDIHSTEVLKFFQTLDEYRESLRPAIFIHGGDYLYKSSPLFEIVRSTLARKNQYHDYIPIIIELRDSSVLSDFEEFGNMNSIRIATAGELNETALDLLIRSRSFTAFEIRKITGQIGSHGGPIAHILEDLKFDTKIEKALENELKNIEQKVKNLIPSNIGNRNHFVSSLCKHNGDAFIANAADIEPYKPLFANGFLYTDEMLHTRVANKAVLRTICAR